MLTDRVTVYILLNITSTGVAHDTAIALWGAWDSNLYFAIAGVHRLEACGYTSALKATLWYNQYITMSAARELTMDTPCLQCIPDDVRHELLNAILLADIPGKYNVKTCI
jgi:hypothetical protein